jgi:sugar-phosphatase
MEQTPVTDPARTFATSALLLDLDGVLALSSAAIERAWRAWATQHGHRWSEVSLHIPGRHATETIRAVAPDAAEEDVRRQAYEINDRQVIDVTDVRPVAGMRSFVASLPAALWAVVTACPERLALSRLRACGYPTPQALITAERVSRGKPDPAGYQQAAKDLGVAPDACLVIEDAPAGVVAARAASMSVIALSTTHDASELSNADVVIQDGTMLRVSSSRGSHQIIVSVGPEIPDTGC